MSFEFEVDTGSDEGCSLQALWSVKKCERNLTWGVCFDFAKSFSKIPSISADVLGRVFHFCVVQYMRK